MSDRVDLVGVRSTLVGLRQAALRYLEVTSAGFGDLATMAALQDQGILADQCAQLLKMSDSDLASAVVDLAEPSGSAQRVQEERRKAAAARDLAEALIARAKAKEA